MKPFLVFGLLLLLVACSVKLVKPTQTDVDRVSGKFPGVTLSDLNQGRTLYEQQCGNCHSFYKPEDKTEEQWEQIVPNMVKEANKKAGKIVLGSKEQDLIYRYLVAMRG